MDFSLFRCCCSTGQGRGDDITITKSDVGTAGLGVGPAPDGTTRSDDDTMSMTQAGSCQSEPIGSSSKGTAFRGRVVRPPPLEINLDEIDRISRAPVWA